MATPQSPAKEPNPTKSAGQNAAPAVPSISLPRGGGAIRGIGEKFAANPVTGTGSMSVPLPASPGRSGFGPQLSLSYDSGSGNGPFGFGWTLSIPAITRKTDKGLPQYLDAQESDVFVLSGSEDLVPLLQPDGSRFEDDDTAPGHTIHRYRPRIEGLFARIERWTHDATGEIHWRSISRDNITTRYGTTEDSRVADPEDPARVFTWLICDSYDDKGNAIAYVYAREDDAHVDRTQANERNRISTANRYLKRIKYGNRTSRLIQPDLTQMEWMFEVVFDYEEGHYEDVDLDPARPEAEQHRFVRASASLGSTWLVRPDPFSSFRATFEVRTYRRCRRVLMFHRFAELGEEPYLVRSTEFEYADLDYSQPTTIEAELAHQGSTRFASFILAVTQTGFVRDHARPVLIRNGVKYMTYLKKSLPPLEFEYSKAAIQEDIRELDTASRENLPIGLDGASYQWVDLDGEGVSGILTEQTDAWYYRPNLGEGCFGPVEAVAARPSLAFLSGGRQQLLDLAGDGQLDLVAFAGPTPGFYERTQDEDWEPLRSFRHLPSLTWDAPNLRFVDLNGDGHADVLITEDEVFTWHPSLAEDGFGPAQHVRNPGDDEEGPRLVLADGTQSIYLADMSGDGLTDLVRVRNGEVTYWTNLGYGRFGAKVSMDNAPWFDNPDQFSQQRVRLADIDGSGTNDIIYLGRDGVRLYFNQSGNCWSEPRRLSQFPPTNNLSSVMTADVLGNGTACLVWSSPLPAESSRPMRYVDLMGGQKPHLLVKSINNLGAETHVHYAPSTKFYLADKLAGKPWVTRLPFPVHVVERVVTYDRISRNRFVTRYAYHHGYFDGIEREFRGFGMVEQWDTERFAALGGDQEEMTATNLDEPSQVPPVLTRTWFHTGVYLGRDHVSNFFAGLVNEKDVGEYYREPGLTDAQARQLLVDDTPLPPGLTIDEEGEACRALKGSMLRQEVFGRDGSDKEEHPYTVAEQNFTLRRLQPKGGNRHAVFFAHARESISYHYERNPADPRIAHALTLEVDGFGNVLKEASIGYGRRETIRVVDEMGRVEEIPNPGLIQLDPYDQAKQTQLLITYTENRVTDPVDIGDDYRTPLPCETSTYELTGYPPTGDAGRFQVSDFVEPDPQSVGGLKLVHILDGQIDYDVQPTDGKQRRLIERLRTLYRPDDLGSSQNDSLVLLPLGQSGKLALPGETYKLAFTPGLLGQVYQRRRKGQPPEALQPDPAQVMGGPGSDRGGYLLSQDLKTAGAFPTSDRDGYWWLPAGRVFHSPESTDTPGAELSYARQHFFLPHRYRDPFHTPSASTETTVTYDAYDVLLTATRDALGNIITVATRDDSGKTGVRIDYRLLLPYWVTDPNGNRTRVAFDALGMVAGTAAMGKPGEQQGDFLEGFESDLTQAQTDELYEADDPHLPAQALLKGATTRVVYDVHRFLRTRQANLADPFEWMPVHASTLARESHAHDPQPPGGLKIQVNFSFSDGFGREILKKIQAEPGPLVEGGTVVSQRWVGSGWSIFNNKGKPVRQYEPFFSQLPAKRHQFEFGVQVGVSPILFYDPAERVAATLHPNHTWEKVLFDAWRQETWDVNDTVTLDPRIDERLRGHVLDLKGRARLPSASYLPTWHALRTDPAHAGSANQRWPDPRLLDAEKDAAAKAAAHAETPTIAHFDSLGRTFLTLAHNGFKADRTPIQYATRIGLDIEGNQREVRDAIEQNSDKQGRIVMRYDYDMLGNRIHQASMEAGERWMLGDVAGKPLYAWDSRNHRFRTAYDPLRRPTESLLLEGAGTELLVGRTVYGESLPNAKASNLRGKVLQVFDQAGVVTTDDYDFKGKLKRSQRRFGQAYKSVLNWLDVVPLEAETYTSRTVYDALSRPVQSTAPHSDQPGTKVNIIRLIHNDANQLEQVHVSLNQNAEPANLIDPATASLHAVANIDYDAKGQVTRIDRTTEHGTFISTAYTHDRDTFRLTHIYTRRGVDPLTRQGAAFTDDCDNPDPPPSTIAAPERPPESASCALQNLQYTYDPVGNITHIRDDAQHTTYFRNKRVDPTTDYNYDAIYRLIEATGREHLGQAGLSPIPHCYNDALRIGLTHPGDGNAMGRYRERYTYDAVGNIQSMQHVSTDSARHGWTRAYGHSEASQLELSKTSNRLTTTSIGAHTETYSRDGDGYDAHGSIQGMPHLQVMQWDFKDQLKMTQRQVVNAEDGDGAQRQGERTWYAYDSAGRRVRKVSELATGHVKEERLYLGGFEIYRRRGTAAVMRETLHIMSDDQRIALVETRTLGTEPGTPAQRVRFQFGNHIGSASLELDHRAQIVSYEEYVPYGSTTYQAVHGQTEAPKRHRYTAMERDEESGFSYHGARYLAAWLGRWIAADPTDVSDGVNLYQYSSSNPVVNHDPSGTQTTPLPKLEPIVDAMTIGDFQGLGSRWKQAVQKVLEPKYGGGSHEENVRRFQQAIEKLPHGSNRAKGTAVNLARKTYSQVRNVFGKLLAAEGTLLPKGTQLHHAFGGIAKAPGSALNASNLIVASGHAKDPASLHGMLHVGERLAAEGVKNPMLAAKAEAEALRGTKTTQAIVAQAGKVEQAAAPIVQATKAESTAAKVLSTGSRILKPLAPVAKVLGKVAGPLGVIVGGVGIATATNRLDRGVAALDTAAGAAAFAGPVGEAFAAGYAVGGLADKGIEWASKKTFGVDLSPSNAIATGLTATDRVVSKLWADPSKPAYTQTLGWKLAGAFGL